ncbi:hypothetical protein [Splendidivirga corallicola]
MATLLLFSCSNKIFIKEGSTLFRLENGNGSKWDVVSYNLTSNQELNVGDIIETKEDHINLTLKQPNVWMARHSRNVEQFQKDFTGLIDFRSKYQNNNKSIAYFSDPDYKKDKHIKIRYTNEKRWKVAAVTITAKSRPFTIEAAPEDSILNTWETKFTPGFALTKELVRWSRMGESKNINTTSIEIGPVFAIGTQEISGKTTRPKFNLSRKALTFTFGGVVNLGINKYDVGIYTGVDVATGKGASDWIYQWQPNWGFIFGIDIVKPQK